MHLFQDAAQRTERCWQFHGQTVTLELWPGRVFVPTSTSEVLASWIRFEPGATTVDLGCGSGLFAILMARMGAGRVHALDAQTEACELTRRNAKRNGQAGRIDCRVGHLFDPLGPLAADLIVNDVSGVADAIARRAGWFPDTVPTGGEDGADLAVAMFNGVRRHLRPCGRVLFPVISLSDENRILEAAHAAFSRVELLEARRFPLAPAVTSAPSFQDLLEAGTIRAIRRGSRWVWELRVFEASAPRLNGTRSRTRNP